MATKFQIETARLLLPHLARGAQRRETPTYGQLGDAIGIHHRPIPDVLGYIRDKICRPRGLPLITSIVENQGTGLPGGRFLPEGTEDLTKEEYRQKFEEHRDRVFAYEGWEDLLEDLHLAPIRKTPDDLNKEGREYARLLTRRAAGGEGSVHRRLKEYVAKHPAAIGLDNKEGATEFDFISGDRCDIVFDLGATGVVVAEVKSGEHDGELPRRIYQVVKYKALMTAERGQGKGFAVRALLVAHRIPDYVAELANRIGVDCRQVDPQSIRGTDSRR